MASTTDVIIKDPDILGGTPVFRGTRVPFKNLLDYLEGGHTLPEFLRQFPTVTRDMAIQALEEAKEIIARQNRVKLLLDECLPVDLRHSFSVQETHTTEWAGLKVKKNGELLDAAKIWATTCR